MKPQKTTKTPQRQKGAKKMTENKHTKNSLCYRKLLSTKSGYDQHTNLTLNSKIFAVLSF